MTDDANKFRLGYPGVRVFCFGVEITDDVLSVNITTNDGNMPNQCQISLNNELDKYITTTRDLLVLSGETDEARLSLNIPWLKDVDKDDFNEGPADPTTSTAIIGDDILARIIKTSIVPERKRVILSRKVSILQQLTNSRKDPTGKPIADVKYGNYFGSVIKKFPLCDGTPIFHPMDPLRVFERDPFNPSRWYHMFAGFISDMSESTDANNVKILTLAAEDPTKLFRYTRAALNGQITDTKALRGQDIRIQSFYSNFMHDFTLPEVFFTVMFGPEKVKAEKTLLNTTGPEKDSQTATRLRGIGHFAFDYSGTFEFGPAPRTKQARKESSTEGSFRTELATNKPPVKLDNLQQWQTIIDHEVQPSDMWTMATESDRSTNSTAVQARIGNLKLDSDGKIDTSEVIKYIGEHPEEYLIDGGRLLMLIPASLGTDNNRLITKDIIQAYPLTSTWTTLGQLLYEVVERIQFCMYSSPKGDIIVEPPLFDFDPDDFGLKEISSDTDSLIFGHGAAGRDGTYEAISEGEHKAPGRVRGPFGTKYIILKRDTFGWENAIVDSKVYTMAIASHAIIPNLSIGDSSMIGKLQNVVLEDLVPLYGVRLAPLTPRGYIATPEGASVYANITLNRLNADAHTMKISHVPNIQMWMNRPIYVQGRNLIGTTKQISHNLTWGLSGNLDTSSDLYAIRTWSGQFSAADHNKPIFSAIGQIGSRPLNYAILTQTADVPEKISDDILDDKLHNTEDLNKGNIDVMQLNNISSLL